MDNQNNQNQQYGEYNNQGNLNQQYGGYNNQGNPNQQYGGYNNQGNPNSWKKKSKLPVIIIVIFIICTIGVCGYIFKDKIGDLFVKDDKVSTKEKKTEKVTENTDTDFNINTEALAEIFSTENKIEFNDSILEAAVRDYLNKPNEELSKEDLDEISIVSFSGDECIINARSTNKKWAEVGLTEPSDLLNFDNLVTIEICNMEITDDMLDIISQLKKVGTLKMTCGHLNDIGSLEKMTWLEVLELDGNNIEDVDNICKLTSLEVLSIKNNKLKDVSKLSMLPNLRKVILDGNVGVKGLDSLKEISEVSSKDCVEEVKTDDQVVNDTTSNSSNNSNNSNNSSNNGKILTLNKDLWYCFGLNLVEFVNDDWYEPTFAEGGWEFYLIPGYWDAYAAFEVYEYHVDNEQFNNYCQALLVSTVNLYYEQSVSLDDLKATYGTDLIVEGDNIYIDLDDGYTIIFIYDSIDYITNAYVYPTVWY